MKESRAYTAWIDLKNDEVIRVEPIPKRSYYHNSILINDRGVIVGLDREMKFMLESGPIVYGD